ncbi:MAG: hypothetical protein Q9162_005732 [Coniocarpon cinnabarinum]
MTDPLNRRALLPREGFHADVLGGLIRSTLLNPFLAVPIYAYFAHVPRGQQIVRERPRALRYTRLLAILAAIRMVNNYLNRRQLNNNTAASFEWTREIALVTGGSDGIGARIVHGLVAKGVKVVVLDVQSPTYQVSESVRYYECDITSPKEVSSTAERIRVEVGHPTILVNNAGVCRGKTILDSTEADVKLTFEVNAVSHYRLAREFIPEMAKRNHGIVVTIASSAAWITAPRLTDYAASKAAALSFHEGLAAELVTHYDAPKVRCIAVCQGYTRTSLFHGFGIKNTFIGPALEVDTMAEAVLRKIFSGTSGHIVVPEVYNLVAANIRGWPWWVQDRTRKRLAYLMNGWMGRQVDTVESRNG